MKALRAEALTALILVLLLSTMGPASGQQYTCLGFNPPDSTQAVIGSFVGKVVFVHAPGESDYYPAWDSVLCAQLVSFLAYESRTQYDLDLTVLHRPGANASRSWELPHAASYYRNDCGSGPCYGDANTDIMLAADTEWSAAGDSMIWDGVQKVIVLYEYDSCVFTGNCPSGRGDLYLKASIPHFVGNGCTLGLDNTELDEPALTYRFLSGVAHEFGHTIGFDDVLGGGTCNAPPTFNINVGRYDLMRSPGDERLPVDAGVPSYHPYWLYQAGWVPVITLSNADPDQILRIPNIRDPVNAVIYIVEGGQNFYLSNYEAGVFGNWDDVYGGDGLLIWHEFPGSGTIRDLESAVGKFTAGNPDPVNGLDSLEADWCHRGSGGDFFGPDSMDFAGDTNPNTNAYGGSNFITQPDCSSIEFRNIHRDSTGDMLVDVNWIRQPLVSPNGGQYFARGEEVPVEWTVTQTRTSCVRSMEIYLQYRAYPFVPLWSVLLADSLSNSGEATVTIPMDQTFTDENRLQVVTRFGPNSLESDASDGLITIWGIEASQSSPWVVVSYSCDEPSITFDISWDTSIETDSLDVLEIYAPGQTCGVDTPSTASATSLGSHHRVVWGGQCQTGTWSYVMKSTKGTSTAVSACGTKVVTQCASCPPPCHPPCELE